LAYCGKIWSWTVTRQLFALLCFIAVVAVLAVLENSTQVWLNACEAIAGIGLGLVVFQYITKRWQNVNLAFSLLLLIIIGYGVLRSYIFAPSLEEISRQMTPMYDTYLKRISGLKVDNARIKWVQSFMLTYQTAIWGTMQITAAFLGYLIYNKISFLKHQVRLIRVPFACIYLMLAALALSLNPATSVLGVNLLVCVSMLYLIQGTGVLSFLWGNFFARSRMLRTLFIITIIINYPVLILIALLGLLDAWFDFRKLTKMEEKHESDSN